MPFQIHGFTAFFFFHIHDVMVFSVPYSKLHRKLVFIFIISWECLFIFMSSWAFKFTFINSWPFDFQIHHFIHKKIRFQIQIWTICIVNFKFPESQHRTALQIWPSSKLHMAHGFFRHPCFQTQGFMDFLWGFHSSHDFCIFIFMDFMIFYFHTHGIRTLLTLTVKKGKSNLRSYEPYEQFSPWTVWTVSCACSLYLLPGKRKIVEIQFYYTPWFSDPFDIPQCSFVTILV